MVCLFSMCSRGVEGHENDKFFIYKTCEKYIKAIVGTNEASSTSTSTSTTTLELLQSISRFLFHFTSKKSFRVFSMFENSFVSQKNNKNVIIHHVALLAVSAFDVESSECLCLQRDENRKLFRDEFGGLG